MSAARHEPAGEKGYGEREGEGEASQREGDREEG